MQITNRSVGDIIIIEVEGSVDSKTASVFEEGISGASEKSDKVVIDFSNIDFLSSAGLRVLLLLYRKIKSSNTQAVLANVSEDIKDVMSDTGFIKFFALADSVDEAVQTLK